MTMFPLSRAVWLLMLALGVTAAAASEAAGEAFTVQYQLPTDGPLPRTYRVTLAVAPADRPDWLVASFVTGGVRTVTEENQGRFTETWDGLDDNFMPVPPGDYVVRGIFADAQRWEPDGEYHTLRLKYRLAAGDSWAPGQNQTDKIPPIYGHVFGPIRDVAVATNGIGAFVGQYIENAWNPFLVDMNRPINFDQVLERFPSAGTGGGDAVVTDGQHIWFASEIGGKPFIYRSRQGNPFAPQPDDFGQDRNAYGVPSVVLPVRSLSLALTMRASGDPVLFATQPDPGNTVIALHGHTGERLGDFPVHDPISLAFDAGQSRLVVMHRAPDGRTVVSAWALADGLIAGEPDELFSIRGEHSPTDLEITPDGKVFVCWPQAGLVAQLDDRGEIVRKLGRGEPPQSGPFDPQAFYLPNRLASWRDTEGQSRLLVIDLDGPGRISEWTTDGELIRHWFLSQAAHSGYCLDPLDAHHLYIASPLHITRFEIDPDAGTWRPAHVWRKTLKGHLYPRIRVVGGVRYLTFAGGLASGFHYSVYRIDGDRLIPSAALIPDPDLPEGDNLRQGYWWHDADGDESISPDEFTGKANFPTLSYWGDVFLEDLTLAMLTGDTVFTGLSPSGFDEHRNPIYRGDQWRTVLVDPVGSRTSSAKPALDGGNEMPPYQVHWAWVDDDGAGGLYLADSFGPSNPGGIDTAGNYFAQFKLSRFSPDSTGQLQPRWRVGRKALRLAEPGEVYCGHYFTGPVHGMVGVFDSNGIYHVYTEDGFFVDTLGLDTFRHGLDRAGVYGHSGESWYGAHYLDSKTQKVYLLMGRAQGTVYEVEGWTADRIKTLKLDPAPRSLTPAMIAPPNPIALALRGGDRPVPEAAMPALGGDLDEAAWQTAAPVTFGLDPQRRAEVRGLVQGDQIHLRWHLWLPRDLATLDAQPGDFERMFGHERAADTMSFYLQGEPLVAPGGEQGRTGDVRYVIGVERRGDQLTPRVLAMHTTAPAGIDAKPMIYRSPVRVADFGHVAEVEGINGRVDAQADGSVVVMVTLPLPVTLRPPVQTRGNFEVTLAGRTKFWWANVAGLTNTNTTDEPSEAQLFPGSWAILKLGS